MEDLATQEIRRLRERVMELEAERNKQNAVLANVSEAGLDVATIAAVLYDVDDREQPLSWCLRALRMFIPNSETIWHEWLERQASAIDAFLDAHPAAPKQAVPIDACDDPCEQCGQPCDGSRCPDSVS